MQDPEIQAIMGDPVMQQILKQMQEDPGAVQEYVALPLSLTCVLVCSYCLGVHACEFVFYL